MYSPACDLCNLSRNSAEKPFWTEGTVPRHCWETNKTARRFGRGATNLSTKACKLGTRSDAESNRRGSTPSDENASALSCTAFRSFSNSTITIAMASSICGIGPRKPPNWPTISRNDGRICPAPISAAHSASANASIRKATEFLR